MMTRGNTLCPPRLKGEACSFFIGTTQQSAKHTKYAVKWLPGSVVQKMYSIL